ncbi:MAG: hypothetical protein WC792_00175 [Candidatus Micrarchaeia archaeon]|jgi:hypothetical protein
MAPGRNPPSSKRSLLIAAMPSFNRRQILSEANLRGLKIPLHAYAMSFPTKSRRKVPAYLVYTGRFELPELRNLFESVRTFRSAFGKDRPGIYTLSAPDQRSVKVLFAFPAPLLDGMRAGMKPIEISRLKMLSGLVFAMERNGLRPEHASAVKNFPAAGSKFGERDQHLMRLEGTEDTAALHRGLREKFGDNDLWHAIPEIKLDLARLKKMSES